MRPQSSHSVSEVSTAKSPANDGTNAELGVGALREIG
jgi:hypothetical protein